MAEKKNEGANVAVGAGVGAAGGILLAELLRPKPAEAATDLTSILAKMDAILAAVNAISFPTEPTSMLTPWVAREPQQILLPLPIRSVGLFQSDVMVDMRNVKRLALRVESSLDQAVAIQVIGNFVESFALPVNIGPPAVCPINGQVGIGLAWGDWQPYIGVLITAAIAPTIGLLTIWAVAQE